MSCNTWPDETLFVRSCSISTSSVSLSTEQAFYGDGRIRFDRIDNRVFPRDINHTISRTEISTLRT